MGQAIGIRLPKEVLRKIDKFFYVSFKFTNLTYRAVF